MLLPNQKKDMLTGLLTYFGKENEKKRKSSMLKQEPEASPRTVKIKLSPPRSAEDHRLGKTQS